jgi:23S rRNA (adenine2503-C2)-methyltransferase
VNVIPLNPTPGFGVPASRRVEAFADEVRRAGANVTIRDTRGREIDAACGQLATTIGKKANRKKVSAKTSRAAGGR